MAEVSDYIIAVIITMIVALSVSTLVISSIIDKGIAPTDPDYEAYAKFNNSIDQYNNLMSATADLNKSVTGLSTNDYGVLGVIGTLINSGFLAFKATVTSFSFMDAVYYYASDLFGIPSWVSSLVIIAIVITLVFSIFSAIFKARV